MAVWLWLVVCGSVVVWLFGYLVVCGCLVVWLSGCLVVWLFGCVCIYSRSVVVIVSRGGRGESLRKKGKGEDEDNREERPGGRGRPFSLFPNSNSNSICIINK